jgi:hypothetical protein
MDPRPIANKYCEGKVKSTLKRELKGREIVKMEGYELSTGAGVYTGWSAISAARACGRIFTPEGSERVCCKSVFGARLISMCAQVWNPKSRGRLVVTFHRVVKRRAEMVST